MSAAALRFVAPLDAARRMVLRAAGPFGRRLVRDRELRVALGGSSAIAAAFLCAGLAPLWMLALGPIVLGVPHLVADVRYLVVRPGLHRRRALWVALGIPLLVAATGATAWGAVLGVVGAALVAQGRVGRRVVVLALALTAAGCILLSQRAATLALAHGHNAIAVLLWWWWRPRTSSLHVVPIALFFLGTVLILAGALDGMLWTSPAFRSALDAGEHLDRLAPGLGETWGARWVLAFAFAQAVHYAVWLRLVPDDDRARATPRSFGATFRALRDDFGTPALVLVGGVALAIGVWASFDLAAANDGYLRLALFHGPLEIGIAALWWTEGRA